VENLAGVESARGRVAAWLLIVFGLVYLIWGLRRVHRSQPHEHSHAHVTGEQRDHAHPHVHFGEHTHVHDLQAVKSLTPWILFTIFVFGPCDPLIPLVMYPAARAAGRLAVVVASASSRGGLGAVFSAGGVTLPMKVGATATPWPELLSSCAAWPSSSWACRGALLFKGFRPPEG
jgi:ABC-type nickel/cobalt efflux system permease component RcnA